MPFSIVSDNGEWNAVYSQGRCGGPRAVSFKDNQLISNVSCRIDGIGDDVLHCRTAHVHHKAGTAIFESHGRYSNGVELTQTSRFFANAVRTTYDLHWAKGVPPKAPVEVGSFILPGKWSGVRLLMRGEIENGFKAFSLENGKVIELEEHPLSMLFVGNNGQSVECSLGFDIWRWDDGLGIGSKISVSIEVSEDCVNVRRFVSDAGSEENCPICRDYRFIMILAWGEPKGVDASKGVELEADAKKCRLVLKDGKLPASEVCLNLKNFVFSDNVKKRLQGSIAEAICLENNFATNAVKGMIRQIAAASDNGILHICGMEPGVCDNGAHIDKKSERLHWDLNAIVSLLAWAANCLGDGWTIKLDNGKAWARELPSLNPNGWNACHLKEA